MNGKSTLFTQTRIVIVIVALAAFLLLVQTAVSPIQWQRAPADFHSFINAAHNLRQGIDPYVSPSGGSHLLQYLYPPTFALLFAPLLTASQDMSMAIWSAFNLPLFAFIVFCMLRIGAEAGARRGTMLLVATLILFGPAWRNIVEGQVNGIVIGALAGGFLLTEREKPWSAGLFFALAAHIKVLPVALVLMLLAQGRWRASVAMVTWLIALIPVSMVWAMWTGTLGSGGLTVFALWQSWITNMVMPVARDTGSWVIQEFSPWNHSFTAALYRLFDPEVARLFGSGSVVIEIPRTVLRMAAWGTSGLGFFLALAAGARGKECSVIRAGTFGLALAAIHLAHVQTWTHHLLCLAFVIPLLAREHPAPRWIGHLTNGAIAFFALFFTLPAALIFFLPSRLGNLQYSLLYHAGRVVLPTVAIVFLWTICLMLTWRTCRRHCPQLSYTIRSNS